MSLWGAKSQLLIAEIGGNHGGDPSLAAKMVEAAAGCGFDGVKFQAYRTGDFLHRSSPYHDELRREELGFGSLASLSELARALSLKFGLTVFGPEGLALASTCACDYIKISSGDITHHPLIRMAAGSSLPLVISTGASTEAEVASALGLTSGRATILQCASLYPAPEATINLAVMAAWLRRGLSAGLSDHALSTEPMRWAYALGARMIEKHFTIDRGLPGGDNAMSLDPAGMGGFVSGLGELEALGADGSEGLKAKPFWGSPVKAPQPGETPALIRRYALAAAGIKEGERLTLGKVAFKRLSPRLLGGSAILTPDRDISNFTVKKTIEADEPIFMDSIEETI